jgi:hypothetical protein
VRRKIFGFSSKFSPEIVFCDPAETAKDGPLSFQFYITLEEISIPRARNVKRGRLERQPLL